MVPDRVVSNGGCADRIVLKVLGQNMESKIQKYKNRFIIQMDLFFCVAQCKLNRYNSIEVALVKISSCEWILSATKGFTTQI